jgi:splicing factor 1
MKNETGTKISIRGKGSVEEGKTKSEALATEDDDLHALISADTEERIKSCIAMIRKVIETAISVPEGQNELKRTQLQVLAQLNGTLRDSESQICTNCGATGHRRFECPEAANFTSQVVCRICNSIGHLARDCLQKNDPAMLRAANQRDQKLDDEYNNLMAQIDGGNPSATIEPTPWIQVDRSEPLWKPQPPTAGYEAVGYSSWVPPPPIANVSVNMDSFVPPPLKEVVPLPPKDIVPPPPKAPAGAPPPPPPK